MGTGKVWGGGDDTSGSRGPGGKLDDRWLKLNSKVGKKQGTGQKPARNGWQRAGVSHGRIQTQTSTSHITAGNKKDYFFANVWLQIF